MKTSRSLASFTLVEVLVAGAVAMGLIVTGLWAAVSYLRIGSHESSSLVGMGKLQALFAQLERDVRDARPRGDVPLVLSACLLQAIDYQGGPTSFAELAKPISQLVSIEPLGDINSNSDEYDKKWSYSSRGWEHNDWPQKFKSADDDLPPFGVPDLERVAAQFYPAFEETFSYICWPTMKDPSRIYFAVFRSNGLAIYTYYVKPTETRPAGAIYRWSVETGVSEVLVDRGVVTFGAIPCFEFAAHPGDLDKGMELVKGGVDIAVSVLEADPGNAIAERRLRLARRVYPEWLQFAPYRVRWVAR